MMLLFWETIQLQESFTENYTKGRFKSNCMFCFFLHQNQYKMGPNVPVRNLIKAAARLRDRLLLHVISIFG